MNYRYWDANAFLGWLSGEGDKVSYCRAVLDAATAGDLTIVTSALTIAEVLWLKGQPRIPAARSKEIEAFFKHRWIVIRELDRFVAEQARALIWDENVRPKDAIHLSTALQQDVEIDQFDTFDEQLIKLSGTLGHPPLLIGFPNLPPKLPLEADDEVVDRADDGHPETED